MTPTPPPASIALANGVERWTLYGFAPGDYYCQCFICDQVFVGDKRATNCLTCAAKAASAALVAQQTARGSGDGGGWRDNEEIKSDNGDARDAWNEAVEACAVRMAEYMAQEQPMNGSITEACAVLRSLKRPAHETQRRESTDG